MDLAVKEAERKGKPVRGVFFFRARSPELAGYLPR
jgi:hypothetical protein